MPIFTKKTSNWISPSPKRTSRSEMPHAQRFFSSGLICALGLALFQSTSASAAHRPAPNPTPSSSPQAPVREFQDEIERDFTLRSTGQLQVTNMRGNIVLQGWSLDKIRVKARRRAT